MVDFPPIQKSGSHPRQSRLALAFLSVKAMSVHEDVESYRLTQAGA
jgi:hypothetical protein